MVQELLAIDDLAVSFRTDAGTFRAVDGVNLSIHKGKTLAIVGESGCGKSVTALAVMGLLPSQGRIETGSIRLGETDLTHFSNEAMRQIRGNRIAMIFQEPMTALNPVYTIGQQLGEVFRIHRRWDRRRCRREAVAMLEKVRIPDPERRLDEYPFQLSGGMRQRVLIAMALACEPDLLIADEPTTALDVTIQAQVLELIRDLKHEMAMSVLFITHDLGVVAEVADDVAVMYAGQVVEQGSVFQIFDSPLHPYTQGLMASVPRFDSAPGTRLPTIEGLVPSLMDRPNGCRFNNRCQFASEQCRTTVPPFLDVAAGHSVACWRVNPNG